MDQPSNSQANNSVSSAERQALIQNIYEQENQIPINFSIELSRSNYMIDTTREFFRNSLNRDILDLQVIREQYQHTNQADASLESQTSVINENSSATLNSSLSMPSHDDLPFQDDHLYTPVRRTYRQNSLTARTAPRIERLSRSWVTTRRNSVHSLSTRRRIIFETVNPPENEATANSKCNCTNTQFLLDADRIDECPICYNTNVSGIKPDCCSGHQTICLSCILTYISEQYNKITYKCFDCNKVDKILEFHYACPFCRTKTCFKNYMFLFRE